MVGPLWTLVGTHLHYLKGELKLTMEPSGASRAAFPCLIKFLNCSKTGIVGWRTKALDGFAEDETRTPTSSFVGMRWRAGYDAGGVVKWTECARLVKVHRSGPGGDR